MPASLTREGAIDQQSDGDFTIIEDHAERRGNSWVIVGKVRNNQQNSIKLTIDYSFADGNGTSLSDGQGRVEKLAPNAEETYEVAVPNNSKITTYSNGGYTMMGM